MTETWAKVDPRGEYEVSDLGRVRSTGVTILRTSATGRVHQVTFPPKVLSPGMARGRLQVRIHGKRMYVHRLVALAFCPGNAAGKEVNHINGDPADNRATNLEWVTRSENLRHSYGLGLHPKPTWWLKAPTPCKATNLKTGEVLTFPSQMDAAVQMFNDSRKQSPISKCLAGKLKTAYGYSWEKL